jgi:O-antigen/teichoic acid export membrane protein
LTVAVDEVVASSEAAPARARVRGVVARLSAASVLALSFGFITGPLLARALGASGRGDLQAVIVPLSLVPALLGFGISPYAYRTLPLGRPVEEVIPSLALPLLVIGFATAAAAIPIADLLAAGRATVRTFLIVGLMATPVVMLVLLLSASLTALERWRAVIAVNMIPFAVTFVGTVVLFATGHLTVATAAAATIIGSLLAIVPGLPLLGVAARRPVFRLSLVRGGLGFGLKSWLGGLAQTANARADQLLMITLVPPRQLGLYAVATTISMGYVLVSGAVAPPLMARIAAGERHLLPQAVRMTVMLTLGLNLAVACITPILLSVLFGPQFSGAVPMAFVLLGASVPLAGAGVLSSALQADGAPLVPSVGEAIALVITGVGLVLLLPPLEGIGAAIVSLAAYSASFLYQIVMAGRRVGVPLRWFVIPCRADVLWARSVVADVTLSMRAAR